MVSRDSYSLRPVGLTAQKGSKTLVRLFISMMTAKQ